MTEFTADKAAKQPFMPLLRELVRAYQAFAAYDASGLRRFGLTVPQADVLFTLGNTEGMTFSRIGELTLITKGTLTGVIDRLEAKSLVKRVQQEGDRRCTRVRLTAKGTKLFEQVFPQHILYLKQRFDRLNKQEREQAEQSLRMLRELFS
jgi:DNA-binding MarR family transcriptional regulator